MNNKITLITVCSRPQYLETLYNEIIKQNYPDFHWIISFDADDFPDLPRPIIGHKNITKILYKNKKTDMTNYGALNNIFNTQIKEDTYIHIIDDDNIIYPNYLHEINNIINQNKNLEFILYHQAYADSNIRMYAKTKDIKQGHIDTAQVCFKYNLVQNTRFKQIYTADGIFYQELFNKIKQDKTKWICLNKVLSYYNYLVHPTKADAIAELRRKIRSISNK